MPFTELDLRGYYDPSRDDHTSSPPPQQRANPVTPGAARGDQAGDVFSGLPSANTNGPMRGSTNGARRADGGVFDAFRRLRVGRRDRASLPLGPFGDLREARPVATPAPYHGHFDYGRGDYSPSYGPYRDSMMLPFALTAGSTAAGVGMFGGSMLGFGGLIGLAMLTMPVVGVFAVMAMAGRAQHDGAGARDRWRGGMEGRTDPGMAAKRRRPVSGLRNGFGGDFGNSYGNGFGYGNAYDNGYGYYDANVNDIRYNDALDTNYYQDPVPATATVQNDFYPQTMTPLVPDQVPPFGYGQPQGLGQWRPATQFGKGSVPPHRRDVDLREMRRRAEQSGHAPSEDGHSRRDARAYHRDG